MPVLVRNRLRRRALNQSRLQALAHRILASAGDPRAELSVELVGDHRMRRLNRQYRRLDRPTDVLAFPMREGVGSTSSLVGDVVISVHTADRQARTAGHSLDQEVVTLLIHGILHLLGYDHERSGREARRMVRKEQAIFRSLAPVPVILRRRA